MEDNKHIIWNKTDNKDYEVEFVFQNKELNLIIKDYETAEKVKGFNVTSMGELLTVMLHCKDEYCGYYSGTYLSSGLLHVNKISEHLENDKIVSLHVYLK